MTNHASNRLNWPPKARLRLLVICIALSLPACHTTCPTSPEDGTLDLPEMVLVTAGAFVMGDGWAFCGQDERLVTLTRDFHLGQYEVTNQEYLEAVQWAYDRGYVTATASSVEDNLDGSTVELLDLDDEDCEIAFDGLSTFSLRDAGRGINPDHPVIEVTWYGAARYCDWLSVAGGLPRAYTHGGDWLCNDGDPYGAGGYRLPTDAEWEYAAQYDDERIYPWGNEDPNCNLANFCECVGWTSSVGSCPAGNTALGVSDMVGNVFEWCNDWFVCDLGTSPETDPGGPGRRSPWRVTRGCSWEWGGDFLLSANRSEVAPNYSEHGLGFRTARTAAS